MSPIEGIRPPTPSFVRGDDPHGAANEDRQAAATDRSDSKIDRTASAADRDKLTEDD